VQIALYYIYFKIFIGEKSDSTVVFLVIDGRKVPSAFVVLP